MDKIINPSSGQKIIHSKDQIFHGTTSFKKIIEDNGINNIVPQYESFSGQNITSQYFLASNLIQERIKYWENSIKNAVQKIQNDDLIETMKEDLTSETFLHMRIKEILEEVLFEDREKVIENLYHKLDVAEKYLVNKENELLLLDKTIHYEQLEVEGLKRTLYDFEMINQQKDQKIEKLEGRYSELVNKLSSTNEELISQKSKQDQAYKRLNESLSINTQQQEQIKQLQKQNMENQSLINQFKVDQAQYLQQSQKSIQELTQTLQKKYEEEKKQLKSKSKSKQNKLKKQINSLSEEAVSIKEKNNQTQKQHQEALNQLIKIQQILETQELQNQQKNQLNQMEQQQLSQLKFELNSLQLDFKTKDEQLISLKADLKQNFIPIVENKQQLQTLKKQSQLQLEIANSQIQKIDQRLKDEIEDRDDRIQKKTAHIIQIENEYEQKIQNLSKQVEEMKERELKEQNEQKILRNLIEKYKHELQELKEKLIKKENCVESEKRDKNQIRYLNSQLNSQNKELSEQLLGKQQDIVLLSQKIQLLTDSITQLNENYNYVQIENQQIQKILEDKLNAWSESERLYNEKIQKCNETIVSQQQHISKQEKIQQRNESQLNNQSNTVQILQEEKENLISTYNEKFNEVQSLLQYQENQTQQQQNQLASKQKEIEELQYKFKLYRHELENIKRKIGESMVEIIRKIKDDLSEMQQSTTSNLQQQGQEMQLIKNAVYDRLKVNLLENNTITNTLVSQIQDKDVLIDELTHQIKQLDLLLESRKQEVIDLQRINLITSNKLEEQENKLASLNQNNSKLIEQFKYLQKNFHELQKNESVSKINEQVQLKENHENNIKEINFIYEDRINNLKKKLNQLEEEFKQSEEQQQLSLTQIQNKYLQSEQQKFKLKEFIMNNIDNRMNLLNQSLDYSIIVESTPQQTLQSPQQTLQSPNIQKGDNSRYNQSSISNNFNANEHIELANTQRSRQLKEELDILQQSIRNTKLEQNSKIRQRSLECNGYYLNTKPSSNALNFHNNSINNSCLSNNSNIFINNNNNNNSNSSFKVQNNGNSQDKSSIFLTDRRTIQNHQIENFKPVSSDSKQLQQQLSGSKISNSQQNDINYLGNSHQNYHNMQNNIKKLSQSPLSKKNHIQTSQVNKININNNNSINNMNNSKKKNGERSNSYIQQRVPNSINYIIPNVIVNKLLSQQQQENQKMNDNNNYNNLNPFTLQMINKNRTNLINSNTIMSFRNSQS